MDNWVQQYEAEVRQMADVSNQLAGLGYVTSHGGNLSLRVADDVVIMTPTKVAKGQIEPADLVFVSMNGELLYADPERKRLPTGEMPFHLRILQQRPDIRGLVHSHPPIMTGFAIAGEDWLAQPFLPEPIIEVGPVVRVGYAEPLSQELAQEFDRVIQRANAFLMENHGVLFLSREDLQRALEFTVMLESMAKSVLVAHLLGEARSLRAEDVANLERTMATRQLPLPGAPGAVSRLGDLF